METALKIETIEDFERILSERPEWKERIRRLILTEELINLPGEFSRFVKEEFRPLQKQVYSLAKDVDTLKEDVEVLKKDVAELKKDVAELKKDVAELKNTVAELKGDVLELKVRDRIGAFLGKLFSKIKLIDFSDLADVLYEVKEKGVIEEKDIDEALKVDGVLDAYLRKPEVKRVFVALEISYVADRKDVERASKRAGIISKAYDIECIPVVLGKKVTKGAKELSDQIGVLVI